MTERFETFTSYMLQLNRYIQRIKEKEMQQFGLHATHTMCLYYLCKYEQGLTSTQLTKLCKEDKAAISRCVKQLMEFGYVVTEQSTQKRAYRNLLFLTEEGKAIANKMEQRVQHVLAIVGEGIDQEQRAQLYQMLEIITNNFAEYLEEDDKK